MKKCLCILLTLLLTVLAAGAFANTASGDEYDITAIGAFSDAWNDYFNGKKQPYAIGYSLTDNRRAVKEIYGFYNIDDEHNASGIGSLADTDTVFVLVDLNKDQVEIWFEGEDLKNRKLEDVVFYTDDNILQETGIENDPDTGTWAVFMKQDTAAALFNSDYFTLRYVADGKTAYLEFRREDQAPVYRLLGYLNDMDLYSRKNSAYYLSDSLIPETAAEPAAPVQAADAGKDSTGSYSLQSDLEKIDRLAKSVFYVDIYDKYDDCIGTASGFVAFDRHVFVTNQHVIEDAAYLRVFDEDNNAYILDAVIASDEQLDLAILLFPDGTKYESLELATGFGLLRGEPVTTIGSPEGLRNTVAFGNLSAFAQDGDITLLQFTAPISHGSSGGILLNNKGQVIGVTSSAITEGSNLGFAIPIELVENMYKAWDGRSTEQLGTKRSWDMAHVPADSSSGPEDGSLSSDSDPYSELPFFFRDMPTPEPDSVPYGGSGSSDEPISMWDYIVGHINL